MARTRVAIRSVSSKEGYICVDVSEVCDGGSGFEEFRRDIKDFRGWLPIGTYGSQHYRAADEALEAARSTITWLQTETPAT